MDTETSPPHWYSGAGDGVDHEVSAQELLSGYYPTRCGARSAQTGPHTGKPCLACLALIERAKRTPATAQPAGPPPLRG